MGCDIVGWVGSMTMGWANTVWIVLYIYIYIYIYIYVYISTTVLYIYIDYSAAFDTESQLFLDSALAETGVSSKVRRIVQAIFAAATGVVRIRQQDGGVEMSEPFNIERGVLQGDIFSPVCFIAHVGVPGIPKNKL